MISREQKRNIDQTGAYTVDKSFLFFYLFVGCLVKRKGSVKEMNYVGSEKLVKFGN